MLRLLARLRGLRGTAFDVFGYSHDRRAERKLISEFEARIDELLPTLNADNVDKVRDIVAAYMDIRGYGPVKDKAISDVHERIGKA